MTNLRIFIFSVSSEACLPCVTGHSTIHASIQIMVLCHTLAPPHATVSFLHMQVSVPQKTPTLGRLPWFPKPKLILCLLVTVQHLCYLYHISCFLLQMNLFSLCFALPPICLYIFSPNGHICKTGITDLVL